jgi:hypothetical protein
MRESNVENEQKARGTVKVTQEQFCLAFTTCHQYRLNSTAMNSGQCSLGFALLPGDLEYQ